jgi:vacuolar protein sorting-associated protein 26
MEVIPMKMEVGIEDCLHIDFEYNKSFYHLRDVIMGRVNFHLVKIKLKSMEIALVRKETFGTGTTTKTETETLIKYEVMDGCPDKGEFIPIRMYMKGIPLAPSYKNIHNRLAVKYWINLVLLD